MKKIIFGMVVLVFQVAKADTVCTGMLRYGNTSVIVNFNIKESFLESNATYQTAFDEKWDEKVKYLVRLDTGKNALFLKLGGDYGVKVSILYPLQFLDDGSLVGYYQTVFQPNDNEPPYDRYYRRQFPIPKGDIVCK